MTGADPKVLYHYTDADGLLGIVTRRELFATDLRFLNDSRELTFARDVVVARLSAAAEELEGNPDEVDIGRVRARVDLMRSCAYEATRLSEWLQVFVSCFCEQADLLGQWRGYGQRAGYSLGFDREALDGSVGEEVSVRKIAYGDESVPQLSRMVQAIIDFPPMGHSGSRGAPMVERDVTPVVVHIEEAAFREEQEWRLATTRYTYNAREDSVEHRAGRLGITPYLAVGFDPSVLREVLVGPGPHPELRKQGVESFLASQGRSDVEVTLSGVAETFR